MDAPSTGLGGAAPSAANALIIDQALQHIHTGPAGLPRAIVVCALGAELVDLLDMKSDVPLLNAILFSAISSRHKKLQHILYVWVIIRIRIS